MIGGADGQPGKTYYVLATTNLLAPLGQWSVVGSNTVGAGGVFSITATDAATLNSGQRFFYHQSSMIPPVGGSITSYILPHQQETDGPGSVVRRP